MPRGGIISLLLLPSTFPSAVLRPEHRPAVRAPHLNHPSCNTNLESALPAQGVNRAGAAPVVDNG